MKDIKKEVDALEVAMQVATDIKDKPYAYAVARIQEALLGNSQITKESALPKWDIKVTKGTDNLHRIWICHPSFVFSCMLVPDKHLLIANAFCQDMENLQRNTWDKVVRRWDLDSRDVKVVFHYSDDGFITRNSFTLEREAAASKTILDNLSQDLIHLQKTSE